MARVDHRRRVWCLFVFGIVRLDLNVMKMLVEARDSLADRLTITLMLLGMETLRNLQNLEGIPIGVNKPLILPVVVATSRKEPAQCAAETCPEVNLMNKRSNR